MAGNMNAAIPDVSTRLAADARSLDALKQTAKMAPEAAVRQAARQFEALFMNMLMKSMREALPKEDMFSSDASRMATGMLDEQWAQNLSGKGLGLADMMIRQLTKNQGAPEDAGLLQKLNAANRAVADPGILDAGAAGRAGPLRRSPAPRALPPAPAGAGVNTPAAAAGVPVNAHANASVKAGTPQDFVQRMMGHAVEAQKASGIPAHFVLGQAALESGWGRREIKAPDGAATHNLFGIKAGRNWQGATVDAVTTEYVNGAPRKVVEKFRAYASYAEAFADYANLLARSSRYAAVVRGEDGMNGAAGSGGAAAFAGRMQAAGYATDPAYARKLTAVINQTLALQGIA